MKFHYTAAQADWDTVASADRNFWQRLAAATAGVVTPGNMVSLIGIGLVLAGLAVMAAGSFWPGLGLLAIGRAADVLDGTLAELTATKGPIGEMVDATMDKIAAIAVLVFFVRDHWLPLVPVVCVAFQVVVNSLLAFTARARRIQLHPSAAGKIATVLAWVVLLVFPIATEAARTGSQGAHTGLVIAAYLLTLVFVVLAVQAMAGYFQSVTAGLRRPVCAAIVFSVTALRIVCAAGIVFAAITDHWFTVLLLSLVAFLTDYLDGWLARHWQVVSDFGSMFDPLADKVVCLTLLAVAAVYITAWYWPLFVVFALYDTFTMTIRFVRPVPMPASKVAKLKTALLMVGLVVVILGRNTPLLAAVLLVAAAALTLRSLLGYTRAIGRSLQWLEHSPGVAVIDFANWHKRYGIRAVLFDIEGTLTLWADPQVDGEVIAALKHARKAGIDHLGLVSNMHPRHSARAAAVADQIDAATYHVTSVRTDRKPSPAMVRAALAKLDVRPDEAGFAGDKIVDVLAAHRAGVARVAWVERLGTVDHPFDHLIYRPVERIVKWAIK